ncbi:MAG: transketolase [Coriobacteriales bacterium]|jgi:transketolase|nr:transketolase [Coriobacteriales bacterium]
MKEALNIDSIDIATRAARLRRSILRMTTAAGSGHPGGSLSAVDIMATLFFGGHLHYDPMDPLWPGRDRFILSKGHAAPVLYATFAEIGYIPPTELVTLRQLGSRLQGHPDMRKLPGVEVSTGSLGQGLSIAVGLALGLDMSGAGSAGSAGNASDMDRAVDDDSAVGTSNAACMDGTVSADTATSEQPIGSSVRVFVLLGDGELQEGQIWEAAMYAAHRRLSRLVAIVDNNELQIDGAIRDICNPHSIMAKFAAFGWHAVSCDGHDPHDISRALAEAISFEQGPSVVVAKTVKGKGVSFMENSCAWHGRAADRQQCAVALAELGATEIQPTGSKGDNV